MNRRPGLAVGLRRVLAVVLTGLAVLVGVHRPTADVVRAAPDQLVPLTSDQQVLAASAALDRIVEVTRDPEGRLVMVLPADVDPLTLEQENPAPLDYPPGSGWVLVAAAALAVLAVRRRTLLVGAAALAGSAAAVGLLVGGSPVPALWWAVAAVALTALTLALPRRAARRGAGSPTR